MYNFIMIISSMKPFPLKSINIVISSILLFAFFPPQTLSILISPVFHYLFIHKSAMKNLNVIISLLFKVNISFDTPFEFLIAQMSPIFTARL